MLPQETIRRKRDGLTLNAEEISAFVAKLADGSLSEGQAAAFAMAVWFRGMEPAETVALTLAMRDSGAVLDWRGMDRPVADKHSTGGVGDNVSLMLAPIAAACGLAVPMISGRGLGHTGGTLDKLESIPGYSIAPDQLRFREVVRRVGCAIIGQTADLAPADRRLYAIRDVTATVDSVPLITASILSKKLAAGLETLVLDVKIGNGAFMASAEEAEALARSLTDVAKGAGMAASALITDMNEPLASAAGNALEVADALAFLRGERAGTRLEETVLALAAEMLTASALPVSPDEAIGQARAVLASGKAAEIFGKMVHMLGGPADLVDRPHVYLPKAPVVMPVAASRNGYLATCGTHGIGMAVIALGGGRTRPEETVDHRTGFDRLLPLGTRVEKGDPIGFVHAVDEAQAEEASMRLSTLYEIADAPPPVRPVIVGRIS